jgi:hypothetical protein
MPVAFKLALWNKQVQFKDPNLAATEEDKWGRVAEKITVFHPFQLLLTVL